MRIIFFSTYFYPYISGLTIYPLRLLNHLSKKNKITVLTFNHSENSFRILNLKFQIKRFSYLFRFSKGFISPQSLIHFWREIQKNDLVILNLPNFEGLALAILAKLFRKKIISIYHCQVDLGKNLPSKIVVFFLNLSVYLQCLLSDTIVGHVDYIDSTYIGKRFKKKIQTVLPPIEILPVSTQFMGVLKGKKKKEIWIGYVGRIAGEKGLEYLAQSIKGLKNVRLVFAGPAETVGESSYLRKIKKLLKMNNINHLFLGELSADQLGAFYKIIEILVLPSVNQTEAFGMAQAEAMVLGTPVVTSNLPGIRVPIDLTKMGLLIKPKHTNGIKRAIKTILENKKKYSNDKLIKDAQNIFDEEKVYKFYERLINEKN